MKLLIHDLNEETIHLLLPNIHEDVILVSDNGTAHHCFGCFGCWIKTPGACVIRDHLGDMGECLSKCDEVTIISQCFYGGFSPTVKKVMDRSISYGHPYFVMRNGEMHHRRRYQNHFVFKVWFYGEDITQKEKQTAQRLIHANSINLDCGDESVTFVRDVSQIKGVSL